MLTYPPVPVVVGKPGKGKSLLGQLLSDTLAQQPRRALISRHSLVPMLLDVRWLNYLLKRSGRS